MPCSGGKAARRGAPERHRSAAGGGLAGAAADGRRAQRPAVRGGGGSGASGQRGAVRNRPGERRRRRRRRRCRQGRKGARPVQPRPLPDGAPTRARARRGTGWRSCQRPRPGWTTPCIAWKSAAANCPTASPASRRRGEQLPPGLQRLTAGAERLAERAGEVQTGPAPSAPASTAAPARSRRLVPWRSTASTTAPKSRTPSPATSTGSRPVSSTRATSTSPASTAAGPSSASRPTSWSTCPRAARPRGCWSCPRTRRRRRGASSHRGAPQRRCRRASPATTGTAVAVGGLSPSLNELNSTLADQAPRSRGWCSRWSPCSS